MQRKCTLKGHLQFYQIGGIMLLLRNKGPATLCWRRKVWQRSKNGEKSCWPGLWQIDSSIDFPFTQTVHPSLLWLHWPISEKKIAAVYRQTQMFEKKILFFLWNKQIELRWNVTGGREGRKIVSIKVFNVAATAEETTDLNDTLRIKSLSTERCCCVCYGPVLSILILTNWQ